MATPLLTRSDVERALEVPALATALRTAFSAYSTDAGARALRVRAALRGPGTATVLFPGVVAGVPAYTVKVHAKFPAERPATRGVLCLHDARSGALLAVMDSTHLIRAARRRRRPASTAASGWCSRTSWSRGRCTRPRVRAAPGGRSISRRESRRYAAGVISTSSAPPSTMPPAVPCTAATVPAISAASVVSIFIASSTTSG